MCSRSCLKFTVVLFNIPIMLIGAACLAVGIWILVDDDSFFDQTADVLDLDVLGSDLLHQCSIAMIVVGSSVFVLAMMGCVGALALSSCLLVFYSLALVLLLVVEVAIVVLAIVFRSELLEKADDVLEEDFLTKYGNDDMFTTNFDSLQRELECCGWRNGDDYLRLPNTGDNAWNRTIESAVDTRVVPDSCCDSSNDTLVLECAIKPTNNSIYHTEGCKKAIEDKFETYIWVIVGVTAGLLLFQFLIMTFALILVVQNAGKKYDMA